MADISKEINDFRQAIYGEEVRGSMISLAEKVNQEVEQNTTNVNGAVTTANQAATTANQAAQDAQTAINEANQTLEEAQDAKTAAAGSASSAAGSATGAANSAQAAAESASSAAESATTAEDIAAGLGGFNGTAASVTASDPNSLDSTNVQGQLNTLGAPVFDDSGTVEGITSFPDFIAKVVSGMKFLTFFRDFKAGLQYILHTGQIVNNAVTNNPNLPVSAAVAYELQNQLTVLNTNLESQHREIKKVEVTVNNGVGTYNVSQVGFSGGNCIPVIYDLSGTLWNEVTTAIQNDLLIVGFNDGASGTAKVNIFSFK